MWPRFGIKVGNSTLCIAFTKSDCQPQVIANKQGDRVSQACLLWDGVNEIECGLTAKQKMALRPKQAVANSLQLMLPPEDLTEEKVTAALKDIPCEYDTKEHTFVLRAINNNEDQSKEPTLQITAFETQTHLLRTELELAQQYYTNNEEGPPIVVLAIPNYYPNDSYVLLVDAARAAGFQPSQIIREPAAAIIAYGIGEGESVCSTSKYVFTIKSGGLYSHFSLYVVSNGYYTELETYGPFPIGGKQYTEVLVQFICEEFKRRYKLDPAESRRSLAKIRTAAANCKHILTTLPSTQLYIDSLMDGIDFNTQMSRARYESLIQPVINSFMQMLTECVEQALSGHPYIDRIHNFVLLGGTMQIPKLQSVIASRYPDTELLTSIPTDEVVAIGCARQATFLVSPRGQQLETSEEGFCSESDIYIWHGDDEANAIMLVERGVLVVNPVVANVLVCKGVEDSKVFKLKSNEIVQEINIESANANKEGVFHIEANFVFKENSNENPMLTLKCLNS